MNQALEINVSDKDYSNFSNFAYSRLNKPKNTVKSFLFNLVTWMLIAIFIMFVLQWPQSGGHTIHWPSLIIGALPPSAGLIVYFYNLNKLKKLAAPNQNGFILGPKILELSDEGLKETSSNGHLFFNWKTVDELANNNGDLYIFVDKTMAVIIPNHSFGSNEEMAEFRGIVEKYV